MLLPRPEYFLCCSLCLLCPCLFFGSTTYFMPSTRDPLLQGIDQRVEEFTRVPQSHQEQVQVLKYDKGQRYTAHHDYL